MPEDMGFEERAAADGKARLGAGVGRAGTGRSGAVPVRRLRPEAGGRTRPRGQRASVQAELAQVRKATARYHRVDEAVAAGYELGWVNGAGDRIVAGCVSHPTAGAMGYHYFNADLMADNDVDAREPEVLVYAPDRTAGSSSSPSSGSSAARSPTLPASRSRRRCSACRCTSWSRRPAGVLHHPRVDLGRQPRRHVRGLQPRGQLLTGPAVAGRAWSGTPARGPVGPWPRRPGRCILRQRARTGASGD